MHLKPCPFCGGHAEIHTEEGRLSGELVCGGCGVMFRSSNRDALPRFWNQRTAPEEGPSMEERHKVVCEIASEQEKKYQHLGGSVWWIAANAIARYRYKYERDFARRCDDEERQEKLRLDMNSGSDK